MNSAVACRRIALAVALTLAMTSCSLGLDGDEKAASGDPLEPGESLGKIERFAGGTVTVTDVRTLRGVQCEDGVVSVRTNVEAILAEMPCDRLLPQAILDRFFGQVVVIRYEPNRLIVENTTIGTMELPATAPRVLELDVTPVP